MKRELKTEILETAAHLFDEAGWDGVSMRRIADTLGISVGNLTYHYKRKEDLLEAVMQQRHEQCRKLPPPGTIRELDGFFRVILHRQSRGLSRACCRRDGDEIAARRLHLQAIRHIGELLGNALGALEQAGLLRSDPARPAVEQALLGMLLLGRPAELLNGAPDPGGTRRCLWQLLSLLLTEKGVEALRELEQT